MLRRSALVLIAASCLALLVPAGNAGAGSGAASDDAELDEARSELELLRLSDARLQDELDGVQAQLSAARADAERLAGEIALHEGALFQLETDARAAEKSVETQLDLVRDRAVEAYMLPGGSELLALLTAEDGETFSQRHAYLDQISRNDQALLADLEQAEDDLAAARDEVSVARDSLAAERAESDRHLADLEALEDQYALVQQVVDERIAEAQGEVDSLEAEQAAIDAILANSSRSAGPTPAAPPGPSAPPPGGSSNPAQATTTTLAPSTTTTPPPATGWSLRWPTSGVVTSEFGMRWGKMHNGIDIGAPTGTPIYACEDGEVIHSGERGAYGLAILIDHGDGLVTVYGHQSSLVATLGQSVVRGQLIGYVGSTGHSTGPHLHLETRIDGVPQDPRLYLE